MAAALKFLWLSLAMTSQVQVLTASHAQFRMVDAIVTKNHLPYQVAFIENCKPICSGVIVAKNVILTAAGCVLAFKDHPDFKIQAGSSKLCDKNSVFVKSAEKLIHEDFTIDPRFNDIALVRISEPFSFNVSTIQAIQLLKKKVRVGEKVLVSGWGDTDPDFHTPSKFLRSKDAHVRPSVTCNARKGIHDKLCLSYYTKGRLCFGDGGAPAVYHGKLVGIANFYRKFCGGKRADKFAKISLFYDWITTRIAEMEDKLGAIQHTTENVQDGQDEVDTTTRGESLENVTTEKTTEFYVSTVSNNEDVEAHSKSETEMEGSGYSPDGTSPVPISEGSTETQMLDNGSSPSPFDILSTNTIPDPKVLAEGSTVAENKLATTSKLSSPVEIYPSSDSPQVQSTLNGIHTDDDQYGKITEQSNTELPVEPVVSTDRNISLIGESATTIQTSNSIWEI